jgi:hypothetical protein
MRGQSNLTLLLAATIDGSHLVRKEVRGAPFRQLDTTGQLV